jgi:type IV pilus assembly protein PilB
MPAKLAEWLLKEGKITPQQLQRALSHQSAAASTLEDALVAAGILKEEEVATELARYFGVPSIDLASVVVDRAIVTMVPAEMARRYDLLPIRLSEKRLTVAVADPANVLAMDDVQFRTGCRVLPVVAPQRAIRNAIERHYGPRRDRGGPVLAESLDGPSLGEARELPVDDLASVFGLSDVGLLTLAEAEPEPATLSADSDEIDLDALSCSSAAAPAVRLTQVLVADAVRRGASHVYIEPYQKEFRVRFRIDGILYVAMALPMMQRDPLISHIKTMAKLDKVEKGRPSEGRFSVTLRREDRRRDVDFSVSLRPSLWGETLVMRVVDGSKANIDRLGLESVSLERMRQAISRPFGLVLVTGPPGSGRTTTLYSLIAALNRPDTSIVTVEDPIERSLAGVTQVQVDEVAGESFVAVLRSLRRQAPDVVALSEIPDDETGRLALHTALNGRLVLATLDTNDAPSTISRVLSMDIHPQAVGLGVTLVQAQRLVRRICAACSSDDTANVPAGALLDVGFPRDAVGAFPVMKGRGCRACLDTGYKGRIGLFESLEVSHSIRDLIAAGGGPAEIRKQALDEGMLSLRMSGLEKIRQGITTIEEVLRETVP